MKHRSTYPTRPLILISSALLTFLLLTPTNLFSQAGCDAIVPTYVVDLTGQPNGTYVSPPDVREGNCCGTTAPDNCIQFIITLDPMSNGVVFSIASGAIPPGAIFYQVNCGPPTPVGTVLCLTGVGPHYLTFCKPGNNSNTYQITSLSQPQSGPDVTATVGCGQPLYVDGLDAPSTTWTSIFPGATGTYNSYLSCTSGCDSVIVTPGAGAPPYVDYLVCGYVFGGCFPFTYCDTIRVEINQELTSVNTNINCFGQSTGSVNLTVPGAAGSTFLWSNGATTEDISGLPAGSYTVTVTGVDGCTRTLTANITQPPIIGIIGSTNNVSCFGGSNGAINITPSGGTGGYSYLWSNGSTTEDISGLTAGGYTVTATDANGCTQTFSSTVTQPAALAVAGAPTNILCFGGATGAIDITPSGGTPGYTYTWSNGAASQDISGVPAGSYAVTVTDANGCTSLYSTNLTQPAAALSVSGTPTNILCFGGATGAIDITPSGGTPGYTYSWSNGAATQDLTGLTAGGYAVTVTDANGCTNSLYSASLTQPVAALSISGTPTQILCFGGATGAIDLTPSGGTPGYTYSWSNGSSSQDLSGLTPGTYAVTVTDANGCTNSSYSTTITQPAAGLSVAGTPTNVLCFGGATGAIDLTPSGGTPGYTYSWSNGSSSQDISGLAAGSYAVTVTDANGCTNSLYSANITQPAAALSVSGTPTNILCFGGATGAIDLTASGGTPGYTYSWSNGSSTQDLSGLTPGTYAVTVTDANGCTNSIYSANITQPVAALAVSGTPTHILCFGGSTGAIDLTPSGGTPGYTYSWSNGSSSQDLSGLNPGTYAVTVTDANGCTNSVYSTNITQPAAALSVTGTNTNVPCYGGTNATIDITPSGGTPAYTYLWSNGSTTQDLSGLGAASYQVVVTDANGCTNSTFVANISQPVSELAVNGSPLNPDCNGYSDGSINITPSGGTIPYYYNWSTGYNDEDIYNIPEGGYTVIVTDANGCSVTGAWDLVDPEVVNMISTITPIKCYGVYEGAISLDIMGGTPAYSILWNTGSTNANLTNMGPGNYSVTVTDSKGCSNTASYVMTMPPMLDVSMDSLYYIWLGESVNLEAFANGGTGGYTYSWSPPDNLSCTDCPSTVASPTLNTQYAITVTDANGCTAIAGAYIEIYFALYVPNTFTPNGDNTNDVFLAASESVKEFTMRIFDRWGEEVFTTNNINEGWSGIYKGLESKQDVYVYRIEATFLNGKHQELVGQVNLIR